VTGSRRLRHVDDPQGQQTVELVRKNALPGNDITAMPERLGHSLRDRAFLHECVRRLDARSGATCLISGDQLRAAVRPADTTVSIGIELTVGSGSSVSKTSPPRSSKARNRSAVDRPMYLISFIHALHGAAAFRHMAAFIPFINSL
jgi:hypothetical protein